MTSSARTRVRRRRQGAALLVVLLAALGLAWSLPWGPDEPVGTARSRNPTPGVTIAPDPTEPDTEPVAAWLAWMPGGFPTGFRTQIAADPAFDATVVVAGDTRWMAVSHDAGGEVVDRPEPPFRIPIDAFAVDPGAYAPFLPDAVRDDVVGALERGEAVLGATSAELRRLGPGGTLTFDGRTVTVGSFRANRRSVAWLKLVQAGLNPRIQQALDTVRVIGNNAVHPGEIRVEDDPEMAAALFELVNLIAEVEISQPKRAAEMCAGLPQGVLDSIERRDS